MEKYSWFKDNSAVEDVEKISISGITLNKDMDEEQSHNNILLKLREIEDLKDKESDINLLRSIEKGEELSVESIQKIKNRVQSLESIIETIDYYQKNPEELHTTDWYNAFLQETKNIQEDLEQTESELNSYNEYDNSPQSYQSTRFHKLTQEHELKERLFNSNLEVAQANEEVRIKKLLEYLNEKRKLFVNECTDLNNKLSDKLGGFDLN